MHQNWKTGNKIAPAIHIRERVNFSENEIVVKMSQMYKLGDQN